MEVKDAVLPEAIPELELQKHIDYLANYTKNVDDFEYLMSEHLRMSGIYWCLTGTFPVFEGILIHACVYWPSVKSSAVKGRVSGRDFVRDIFPVHHFQCLFRVLAPEDERSLLVPRVPHRHIFPVIWVHLDRTEASVCAVSYEMAEKTRACRRDSVRSTVYALHACPLRASL